MVALLGHVALLVGTTVWGKQLCEARLVCTCVCGKCGLTCIVLPDIFTKKTSDAPHVAPFRKLLPCTRPACTEFCVP